MASIEKRGQFVELRGRGMSYAKISVEIGVSKTSLIRWSKELKLEISNAQAMELERIREEYLLGKGHRIRVNGTQLNHITEELLKRDLSEVPTPKLFEMQRKLIQETEKDSKEIVFAEEQFLSPGRMVLDTLTKVERWTG